MFGLCKCASRADVPVAFLLHVRQLPLLVGDTRTAAAVVPQLESRKSAEGFAVGRGIHATNCRRQRAACGEGSALCRNHVVHAGRSLAVLAELGLGSTCMYPSASHARHSATCAPRPLPAGRDPTSRCTRASYKLLLTKADSEPLHRPVDPCSKCSAAHHGMHVAYSHYCRAGGAV